jgi:hypothetical protein
MRIDHIASAGLLTALALAACSLPAPDKASDAAARGFFDEVRSGADLSRDPHVDASLLAPDAAAAIAQIKAALPPGAPSAVRDTGWSFVSTAGTGAKAQLSHAYTFGARTITIQTVLTKPPGGTLWRVIGVEADLGGEAAPIVAGAPPKQDSGASSDRD